MGHAWKACLLQIYPTGNGYVKCIYINKKGAPDGFNFLRFARRTSPGGFYIESCYYFSLFAPLGSIGLRGLQVGTRACPLPVASSNAASGFANARSINLDGSRTTEYSCLCLIVVCYRYHHARAEPQASMRSHVGASIAGTEISHSTPKIPRLFPFPWALTMAFDWSFCYRSTGPQSSSFHLAPLFAKEDATGCHSRCCATWAA